MKRLILFVAIMALSAPSFAQDQADLELMNRLSCTSIMVGKGASADGSVITSHTCDSWYRTWMEMAPAADHTVGEMEAIYDGRMHTQSASDSTKLYVKGYIPQVAHTYRFLDTAYPSMNEKQLAMGETTYTGRAEMINKNGMFMIEELQRVALERCTTAREAIRLMGDLASKYGYGDSGECLTVADPNEVWIFEIQGEGPDKLGAVWAAVRIPDDEIGVSANVSRIGRLDLADKDHYMASSNVKEVAKKMGFWDGKGEFSFWKAYSGTNYMKEVKNYSVRELFIMQQLAPSAGFTDEMEELPVSVKPDNKVTLQQVFDLLSSYYEGTDLDMSGRLLVPDDKSKESGATKVSPKANPWMRGDEMAIYKALGDTAMKSVRVVSEPWCAYSTVIQLRSWLPDEVGGVAWISFDNPGQSPRIPVFAGCTRLPEQMRVCGQHSVRDESAIWQFRKANRLSTVLWGTFRTNIEESRAHFFGKGLREMPFVENTFKSLQPVDPQAAVRFLNDYTFDYYSAAAAKWKEMERYFWQQTWKGF